MKDLIIMTAFILSFWLLEKIDHHAPCKNGSVLVLSFAGRENPLVCVAEVAP